MANLHNIDNERVQLLEYSETSAKVQFFIPANSDFFHGHFPSFKLLPAVAQFWCVTHFAQKFLKLSPNVKTIKRVKFVSPIMPDTTVILELSYNNTKNLVTYELSDASKIDKKYSLGTFCVEAA